MVNIQDKVKDLLSEKCVKFNTHANRKRITAAIIELIEDVQKNISVTIDNKPKYVSIRDSMTITHPNPNANKDPRSVTIMTPEESAKGDDFSTKFNKKS
jgi:hypothetical protein